MTDLRQAAQQALEALGSGNPYHQQLAAKVLRTALEQQAEPPPEWLLIKNILDEYGLQAIDFVAEFKAAQQVVTIWKQPKQQAPFSPEVINTTQTAWKMGYEAAKAEQQAEPVCPKCKAAVLYECVACSSNNYPPKQQAEPVACKSCQDIGGNWAWKCNLCGEVDESREPEPPQRPWVGLTDEEILSTDPWEILRADPWMGTSDSNINPYQILLKVRTLEAKLKERNHD